MKKRLGLIIIVFSISGILSACGNTTDVTDDTGSISTDLNESETTDISVSEEDDTKETVDTFRYEYNDENYLTVSIDRDIETDELSVIGIGFYSEGNEGLMAWDWLWVMTPMLTKGIDSSYYASVGNESYMQLGSLYNTMPDNIEDYEIPDEYTDGATDMYNQLYDFYTNNGISIEGSDTAISRDEYKAQCQDISYDDLARNPDLYEGQYIKFTGKVIQTQEEENSVVLRINVTEDEYGFWDDTILVGYNYSEGESRILEDDIVTFYGISSGLINYESITGQSITIPGVAAQYIDIN